MPTQGMPKTSAHSSKASPQDTPGAQKGVDQGAQSVMQGPQGGPQGLRDTERGWGRVQQGLFTMGRVVWQGRVAGPGAQLIVLLLLQKSGAQAASPPACPLVWPWHNSLCCRGARIGSAKICYEQRTWPCPWPCPLLMPMPMPMPMLQAYTSRCSSHVHSAPQLYTQCVTAIHIWRATMALWSCTSDVL